MLRAGIAALSDDALAGKTVEFRQRLAEGATLDEQILPEAFAVVREAGRRVLGMRHFDVQLVGGMVLNDGKIAEMKTGEGKTLVATLPVYLNALSGQGRACRYGERLSGDSAIAGEMGGSLRIPRPDDGRDHSRAVGRRAARAPMRAT